MGYAAALRWLVVSEVTPSSHCSQIFEELPTLLQDSRQRPRHRRAASREQNRGAPVTGPTHPYFLEVPRLQRTGYAFARLVE
jgi:hypothetical protein